MGIALHGMGVIVDVVREHRPDLARVFVGNGDQHFAEGQAGGKFANP